MSDTAQNLTVNTSATTAILTSLLTRGVGLVGAALVAKGYADTGTVTAATPEIVGGIMALGSLAYGWWLAKHNTARKNDLAAADPSTVTFK